MKGKSSGNWPTGNLWQELSYDMQIVLPHCCAPFNRRGRKGMSPHQLSGLKNVFPGNEKAKRQMVMNLIRTQ